MNPIFRQMAFLMVAPLFSQAFFNGTIQYAAKTKNKRLIYALSAFKRTDTVWYYLEGGVVFMPDFSGEKSRMLIPGDEEKKYHAEFYGAFIGYHIAIFPIFRPGVVLGSLLKKDEVYWKSGDGPYRYKEDTPYFFTPYFGFSVHSGIFSFLWTNTGIGGGLNLKF